MEQIVRNFIFFAVFVPVLASAHPPEKCVKVPVAVPDNTTAKKAEPAPKPVVAPAKEEVVKVEKAPVVVPDNTTAKKAEPAPKPAEVPVKEEVVKVEKVPVAVPDNTTKKAEPAPKPVVAPVKEEVVKVVKVPVAVPDNTTKKTESVPEPAVAPGKEVVGDEDEPEILDITLAEMRMLAHDREADVLNLRHRLTAMRARFRSVPRSLKYRNSDTATVYVSAKRFTLVLTRFTSDEVRRAESLVDEYHRSLSVLAVCEGEECEDLKDEAMRLYDQLALQVDRVKQKLDNLQKTADEISQRLAQVSR